MTRSFEAMFDSLRLFFSDSGFMPHGHCYLWTPSLLWSIAISDALIGTAYIAISITLYILIKKIQIPFSGIILSFGLFIGACGSTHLINILTIWKPFYWISASISVITALASVSTAVWLFKLRQSILQTAAAAKLSEQRQIELEDLNATLEKKVLQRTAELEQMLQSRDEFLSIASHELKTPLSSLKLHAQIAKRSIERDDPQAYSTERIKRLVDQTDRQVNRLSRLVDDMLDISRIRTGKLSIQPELIELNELIIDVIDRLKPAMIEAGTPPLLEAIDHASGSWDRFRLEQVITNLLTNAMKYGEKKPVVIRLKKENSRALLTVQDHGIGIPITSQKRIFNRFERAIPADKISGLGLRLFITDQIIQAHGGRIWAESLGIGAGSTFYVELPFEQQPA